jgi:hypothetical protein
MAYKRNQIIEAIEATLDRRGAQPLIATRLKRLLHADRLLGRNPRSKLPDQSTYAFFAGELSGTGNENLYSAFEAFALLLGIRLLENGFPQRVAVRILRCIRTEFESSFSSEWRAQKRSGGARWYLARLAPVGLDADKVVGSVGICRGEMAVAKFLKGAGDGQIMTVIELTRPMLRFKAAIDATLPVKRGRQ